MNFALSSIFDTVHANPSAPRDASTAGQLQYSMEGRTFTLFPKLPPEIRIKIWMLTMPKERFIQPRHYQFQYAFDPKNTLILGADPPASLVTCRESRLETLLRYKPFKHVLGSKSSTIYLNPDVDVLCLNNTPEEGGGNVWRAFAAQGIIFRKIHAWHLNEFLSNVTKHEVKVQWFEELLIAAYCWQGACVIRGFTELGERDFKSNFYRGEVLDAYIENRRAVEEEFKRIVARDQEWRAPRLRIGVFF